MHDVENHSFGRRLRAARETAGWSQAAVAEKLRLQKTIVDALEREDLQALPAPAYVRGYIRAYAQLVGCSVEELLARYNAHATDEPQLTRPVGLEPEQDSGGTVLRWGSVAVVVVLLGLAGVWLYDYIRSQPEWLDPAAGEVSHALTPDTELDDAPEPTEAQPSAGGVANNQPSWMEDGGALGKAPPPLEEDEPVAESPSLPETASQGAPSQPDDDLSGDPMWQETTQTEAPAVPEGADPEAREVLMAPQGKDNLELELDGPSWVEAFDANGYRLVYGLFDRSDSGIVVRGKAPFQVVLGDATQVRLSINDSPLELEPYIRSNKTARLLVEPPEAGAVRQGGSATESE